MITALANAGAVFGAPSGSRCRGGLRFHRPEMTGSTAGSAYWRAGRARHPAMLDDYANMSRAALALHEATGEAAYLARPRPGCDWSERWDGERRRLFLHRRRCRGADHADQDGAGRADPSGNGVMVGVLARLYHLTGNDDYRERAEARWPPSPATCGAISSASARSSTATSCCSGRCRSSSAARAALRIPRRCCAPSTASGCRTRCWRCSARGGAAARPSRRGQGPDRGSATAYVCQGPVCSLPLTDPAALAAERVHNGALIDARHRRQQSGGPLSIEEEGGGIVGVGWGRERREPTRAAAARQAAAQAYFAGTLIAFDLPLRPAARPSS